MSIFPGWDSIETTSWISNLFFGLSIGALILLGVTEVISHFYGNRHDTLLAERYREQKYGTDSEIARLHKATAEANLALEKFKAPRLLTAKQIDEITKRTVPFRGLRVILGAVPPSAPNVFTPRMQAVCMAY